MIMKYLINIAESKTFWQLLALAVPGLVKHEYFARRLYESKQLLYALYCYRLVAT